MWSKLCDSFYDHPKVVACTLEGIGLHALALSYCGRHLTGGEFPKSAPFLRGKIRLTKELCKRGLWEKTSDGFRVHDWADYNPTAGEAREYRAKMQQVHLQGGRARAATASRIAGRFAPAGTSSVAGELHQQATSPVPVPVPVLTLVKDKELLSSTNNGSKSKEQLREECFRLLAGTGGVRSLLDDAVLSQLVRRGQQLGLGAADVRQVALEVQQQH